MPVDCRADEPGIATGDAVCFVGMHASGKPNVRAATRPELDAAGAVYGTARNDAPLAGDPVSVAIHGEVALALDTGLPAGPSTLVATNLYAATAAAQRRLVHLPLDRTGDPHEPPTRVEHIVGTSDTHGNTAVQITQRGFNSPVRYNVRAYGARGDGGGGLRDITAFHAALAAMDAADPDRGAVLEIPPPPGGFYFMELSLHIGREVQICGTGSVATPLRFQPGHGVLIDGLDPSGASQGGRGSVLENVTVTSNGHAAYAPRPVGALAAADLPVVGLADHRWWFGCIRAGTTGVPDPFGQRVHVLSDPPRSATFGASTSPDPIVFTCFSHGLRNGMWVVVTGSLVAGVDDVASQVANATVDTFTLGFSMTTGGSAPGAKVRRTTKIVGAARASAGQRIKVTTETPTDYPDGTFVHIFAASGDLAAYLNDGTFAITNDASDATHKSFWLELTNDTPVVSGAIGYFDVVIPDGSAVDFYRNPGTPAALWVAYSNSGITVRAHAEINDCTVEGFINAGVLVDGTASLAGGNARGVQLTNVRISACGLGVGVVGKASSFGTGWGVSIERAGMSPLGSPTFWQADGAGYGIQDASARGCTWVGCRVLGGTGPSYVGGGGTSRSVFAGCFTAKDAVRPRIVAPSMLLGGASNPVELDPSVEPGGMGMVLRAGNCRNVNVRSDTFGTRGGLEQGHGPTALWFGHDDDGLHPLIHQYGGNAYDREWHFRYSSRTPAKPMAGRSLLSYTGAGSPQGKGNWRDDNGHLFGDRIATVEEPMFVGPESARTDKYVRGGGTKTGGPGEEQFRVGDRFWFRAGAAGELAGWIVRTPGFRGVPWQPNHAYEDDGSLLGVPGLVADLVEPMGQDPNEPEEGGQVWRCVGSGTTGVNPNIFPMSPPAVGTEILDGTVTWRYVGTVALYNRIGLIRAEGEDDFDSMSTNATGATLFVTTGVRVGRTRSVFFTGGSATTLSGFLPPIGPTPLTAQLIADHPQGLTLVNEDTAVIAERRLANCPTGAVASATFVYSPFPVSRWFCTAATPV